MQLDTTTRKIQAVLTAGATTAAMNVTVDYVDITASALPVAGLTPTNTNGTTPVDILAAPAVSTVRKVNAITIYNADSAAKTVSVNLDDNGTDYLIIKTTLQVGETLAYTDTRGWYSLDANGNTKVSPLTSMTSAQLAALLSDETGTGSAVFSASPTLTGTTQVAALTASGLVTLTGGQLKFPATQVPSADANTLDDYEEGTWTPVVAGTSSAGTGTYTTQAARYVKIGRLVHLVCTVVWSAHDGTGNITITGLPFTAAVASGNEWLSGAEFTNMTMPASTMPLVVIAQNQAVIRLYSQAAGSGTATALAMDAAAGVYLSITYEAA